jgi:hypothetical protein
MSKKVKKAQETEIKNWEFYTGCAMGIQLTKFFDDDNEEFYSVSLMNVLEFSESGEPSKVVFQETALVTDTKEEAIVITAQSLSPFYDLFGTVVVFDEEGEELETLDLTEVVEEYMSAEAEPVVDETKPRVTFH